MEEETRPRRPRADRPNAVPLPDEPMEGVEGAWLRLQGAVDGHNLVGQDGDPEWVRAGLRVVRRRAQTFLRALESLIDGLENG